MDKIYMVTALFEDWDDVWWKTLGIFTNKEKANEIKDKWEAFYKDKSVFNPPKDKQLIDGDDYWVESDEYMILQMKYSEILHFKKIEIQEFPLNKDIAIESSKNISIEMKNRMMQYDRAYKLKSL